MFSLTRREQLLIVAFFFVFLLGLGMKQWRSYNTLRTFQSEKNI